jgi:hypothetical protein
MKTIYSSAFICFFLVWLSSQAQVNQTTTPSADSGATIPLSPAEAAVLEAASNAVQAATIIWLPDQPLPAIQWPPASVQGRGALSDAAGVVGVAIRDASSNGQTTVRFVYQTSPAVVAAAMSAALGAAHSINSPQPLDSLGGCVPPGSGLIGWWQAEDNANDSAGFHPGQTPNGVSFVAGKVGQAFALNGSNQSVQIPYTNDLATAAFSVEVWVNPTNQIGWQAFVFGQAYGRQLVVSPGSGGLNVSFFVTDTNGSFYGVYSSRVIALNQWTHLAGTWDGSSLKLYLNGVQDRSASLQLPAIGNSGCPFSIGGMNNSCSYSGQYFPGLIDEVSLYNRALLAGEINAIYLAGSAGKCKTPSGCATCPLGAVASWPGEGDASDMFANNCPGTLQNGVAFDQGMVSRAFSFNGTNQAVEIPDTNTLATTAFSVEAWVRPASQAGGQAFIFGQSYGRQLLVRPGTQGLLVAFVISNNGQTFHEVDSSADITIGEWSHLVGTWDGGTLSLYVNGALEQQAPLNTSVWDSGCAFHIGGVYDPAGACAYVGQFFSGLIDETTYYSQALCATDVAALYSAGGAGKCGSLGNWLLHYFGPNCWNETNATATADADGDGVINLQEYFDGTDPNRITFFARFPNYWVNSTTAHGSFDIYGGVPLYMAILVNTSNFAAAEWQPYTSDFTVPLGSTDGVYNVWIGLRGWSEDSHQTWNWTGLTRDLAPPAIMITSPTSNVTAQPMIDLRGYSPERLLHLYYDVANAAGTISNIQGFITDQYFDPQSREFTTNWFLCADIELANGANTITLRATDLAGNVSTNVFTYTLDLAAGTNPPVLSLYWPQDGEMVCGNQFTLRGRLDDPTATVTAQITDAIGNVNIAKGLVERNGLVWVENLPLAPGTNTVMLTMTNASGYWSTTNLAVIRSDDVNLTIDDVPQDQLNNDFLVVTGTIDSLDFTVWVNGVMVTNLTDNGNGTWRWEADLVPLNSGGTATIQAVAIPNSANGGQGSGPQPPIDNAVPGNPTAPGRRGKEADPEKTEATFIQSYHATYANTWDFAGDLGGWEHCHYFWAKDWTNRWAVSIGPLPANGLLLGTYHEGEEVTGADADGNPLGGSWDWAELDRMITDPDQPSATKLVGDVTETRSDQPGASQFRVGATLWSSYEKWQEHTPWFGGWSYVEGLGGGYTTGKVDRTESIHVTLFTGGKRLPKWKNFFSFTGAATNYPTMDSSPWWVPQTVSPEAIQVQGKPLISLGMLWPEGMTYKALPDNEMQDITPFVDSPRYQFTVNAVKHKLILQHYCVVGGDTRRTDLGVGERVTHKFAPDLVTNSYWYNTWSSTAGSVWPTDGNETTFTAPSNASPATVTAVLGNEQVDVPFGVAQPSGIEATLRGLPDYYWPLPAVGAGMYMNVVIQPTNVSFYRLEIEEPGASASKRQGYFVNNPPPDHGDLQGANKWHPVVCNPINLVVDGVFDHASSSGWPIGVSGSYTWPINPLWRIAGDSVTHPLSGWTDQVHTLGADGTVIVEKLGHHVTRSPYQPYGTAQ